MTVAVDAAGVQRRIAAVLRLPAESVSAETELADVVADSFALVEMMIELQEDYGVAFGQDDIAPLRTAGDVAELIAQRVAAAT